MHYTDQIVGRRAKVDNVLGRRDGMLDGWAAWCRVGGLGKLDAKRHISVAFLQKLKLPPVLTASTTKSTINTNVLQTLRFDRRRYGASR
jgi:hypothetical protein